MSRGLMRCLTQVKSPFYLMPHECHMHKKGEHRTKYIPAACLSFLELPVYLRRVNDWTNSALLFVRAGSLIRVSSERFDYSIVRGRAIELRPICLRCG
jgi:hypothetical protein